MKAYLTNPIKKKQYVLCLGDILIFFCTFLFSYFFRVVIYEGQDITRVWDRLPLLVPIAVFLHVLSLYIFELYAIERQRQLSQQTLLIGFSLISSAVAVAVASYMFPVSRFGAIQLSIQMPLLGLLLFFWRTIYFSRIYQIDSKNNLAYVDFGETEDQLRALLNQTPLARNELTSVIRVDPLNPENLTMNGQLVDGSLGEIFHARNIRIVVVGEGSSMPSVLTYQLLDLRFKGMEVYDYPTFYSNLTGKIPVAKTKAVWLLFSLQEKSFRPFFYEKTKRIYDILIASAGFLLAAPLFTLIIISIKFTSKGPVFFRQERLGLEEKPFSLIKFRTMVDDAEKLTGPKWSSKDDPRITNVGKFLRKTRLDELPQLINIISGEMSFVGPRPIRKHFADILAEKFPFYRLRFLVKPGVTGWAQVNGDYAGSDAGQLQKLEYELFYIKNQSFFLDFYTIIKTFRTIIFSRGL